MFKSITLISVLFFISLGAFSQSVNSINFTRDDGLSTAHIYSLCQDSDGYIWMATDGTLYRYDGYSFKSFIDEPIFKRNIILRLFPQEDGQIWGACLNNELFYFNEDFDGFHPYEYNDTLLAILDNFGRNNIIKSLRVDAQGDVHLGGYAIPPFLTISKSGECSKKDDTSYGNANYLSLVDQDLIVSSKILPEMKNHPHVKRTISGAHIDAIRLKDNITVFMAGEEIIFYKDGETNVIRYASYPQALKKINDSLIFVGYFYDGARFYNEKGQLVKHILKNCSVSDIAIDHIGGYWISTLNRGLFYIRNIEIQNAMEDIFIKDLAVDKDSSLYIGLIDGTIVSRNNGQLDTIYIPDEVSSAAIFSYHVKGDSMIMYSSNHTISRSGQKLKDYNYRNFLPEYIDEIQEEYVYHTWPFNINDSIYTQKLPGRKYDVAASGRAFYIGTERGLFQMVSDSLIDLGEKTPLFSGLIGDIDIAKNQKAAYFCTNGNGLVVYRNNRLFNISIEHGLLNNTVYSVSIEDDSTVWAATVDGINRIQFKEDGGYSIKKMTKRQGLMDDCFVEVITLNDTVWVASRYGLSYFPKSILEDRIPENLFFRLKRVGQGKDTIQDGQVLSYDQNTLTFYLNAISFDRNEKLRYFYRLENMNDEWQVTQNREIPFQNLPPNHYTFYAKAELEGHFSNETIVFHFTITPPFWSTWWFRSICILAVSFVIYLFFKIRILTYNRDVVRELIRLLLKRIKKDENSFVVRSDGEDIKIISNDVLYVKSSGNYLELHTTKSKYVIRGKIGEFIDRTPDPLEYLRIQRSYIVRIDSVEKKGANWVIIQGERIPVGEYYKAELKKIQF